MPVGHVVFELHAQRYTSPRQGCVGDELQVVAFKEIVALFLEGDFQPQALVLEVAQAVALTGLDETLALQAPYFPRYQRIINIGNEGVDAVGLGEQGFVIDRHARIRAIECVADGVLKESAVLGAVGQQQLYVLDVVRIEKHRRFPELVTQVVLEAFRLVGIEQEVGPHAPFHAEKGAVGGRHHRRHLQLKAGRLFIDPFSFFDVDSTALVQLGPGGQVLGKRARGAAQQ